MKAARLLFPLAGALILFALARAIEPEHGLSGRYYLDTERAGDVVNASLDERIDLAGKDLAARAGRSEGVGAAWEGYIRLARKTTFRISLRSDDGSWLRIDDSLVIDNGGVHAFGGFDADVPLDPGAHHIRIDYFNAAGDGRIELRWRRTGILGRLWPGPRFTPEPIEAASAALDQALNAASRILGLIIAVLAAVLIVMSAARFKSIADRAGRFLRDTAGSARASARSDPFAFLARGAGLFILPILLLIAIRALGPPRGLEGTYYASASWEGKPVLSAVDRSIHFEKTAMVRRAAALAGPAGVVWKGVLHVPGQSVYRFELISDDGSTLEIDGRLLVDNGGFHPSQRAVRDALLAPGNHPVRIKYFDAGDGGHVDVFVRRKAGLAPFYVPAARFYPQPPSSGVKAAETALIPLKLVLFSAALVAAALLALGFKAALNALPGRLEPLTRSAGRAAGRAARFFKRRAIPLAVIFAAAWLLIAGARIFIPVHGLTASYYRGPAAEGSPVSRALLPVVRFDKTDFRERTGGPGPAIVVAEGYVFAPKSSDYRFEVASADPVEVEIDGQTVLRAGPGAESARAGIALAKGPHRLRLSLASKTGTASLDFRWSETKTPRWRMPPLRLYPDPPGRGVVLAEVALPAAVTVLKAIRFAAGCVLVLLALGAALPRDKVFAAVPFVLAAVAAAVFFGQALARRSTAVEGCDTYAYLQGAEIIAREGPFRTDFTDPLVPAVHSGFSSRPAADKEVFVLAPHGYYVQDLDRGEVVNTFPPGMSMLLAPVVAAAGRSAAFWFVPLVTLFVFAGFFILGTKAEDPVFGLGIAAAAVLNEPVFANTVLIMSDVPSLALVGLSGYLLYRNRLHPRRAWPLLAGAVFGFSLLVRYSNVAAAVPLALLLWPGRGSDERPARGFLRNAASFAAAAVLAGLLPLGIYTARLFGTPFRLVYDPVNMSRMTPANIPIGASFYGGSLWRAFGPAGIILASIGLLAALGRRPARRAAAVGLAGVASFFLFYSMQSIRHDRYLIPGYVFLALLAALGLLDLVRAARRSRVLIVLILAAASVLPLARAFGPKAVGFRGADAISAEVKARAGSEAVIFCDQLSGPVRLYAGLSGYRFSWTDPPVLAEIVRTLDRGGRPVYFVLDNPVAEDRFREVLAAAPELAERLHREPDIGSMPFYLYVPTRQNPAE